MGIAIGVPLLLIGLVLVFDVLTYDIPRVADDELGMLLVVVGVATVLLWLISSALRSRRARVEEHHYDHRMP